MIDQDQVNSVVDGIALEHEFIRTGKVVCRNQHISGFGPSTHGRRNCATCLEEVTCHPSGDIIPKDYAPYQGSIIGLEKSAELIDFSGSTIEGNLNLGELTVDFINLQGTVVRGYTNIWYCFIDRLNLRQFVAHGRVIISDDQFGIAQIYLEDADLSTLELNLECHQGLERPVFWCSAAMAPVIRALAPSSRMIVSFKAGKYPTSSTGCQAYQPDEEMLMDISDEISEG